MSKIVFISGTSSGIGYQTALHLHQAGQCVIGTKLPHETPPATPFEMLNLDVTNDENVRECVQRVIQQHGRIDVLVNNAGIALMGAVEETSLEEARWQMEVNFWGTVKLTQAVLPHMRQQKSGTIINISSLLGLFGTPFSPFYAASKHAIEGFTKSLRYEVAPFGIQVSMIEPGFVKTDLMKRGRKVSHALPAYTPMQTKLLQAGESNQEQGFDPQIIAETIETIIQTPKPRLSYPLFLDNLSNFTSRLPEPLRERVIHYLMGVYNPLPDLPYIAALVVAGVGVAVSLRQLILEKHEG